MLATPRGRAIIGESSNYDFFRGQQPWNNGGKERDETRSIGETVYPSVAWLVFGNVASSVGAREEQVYYYLTA